MMMMMMMKKATCRLAGEFSCLQPAAGTLLTKCSKFLRFAVMMFFLFCYVLLLYCLFHCCSPSAQDSKYFHVNASRQELPKDFGILCDFDREDFETFQVLFNYQMNSKYNKSSNYLTKIGFILGKDWNWGKQIPLQMLVRHAEGLQLPEEEVSSSPISKHCTDIIHRLNFLWLWWRYLLLHRLSLNFKLRLEQMSCFWLLVSSRLRWVTLGLSGSPTFIHKRVGEPGYPWLTLS